MNNARHFKRLLFPISLFFCTNLFTWMSIFPSKADIPASILSGKIDQLATDSNSKIGGSISGKIIYTPAKIDELATHYYYVSGTITADNYSDAFYHNIRCQDIKFDTKLLTYTTAPDLYYRLTPTVTVLYDESFAPAPITGTYLSNGCNYSLRLGVYNGNVYSPYANPQIVVAPYIDSSDISRWILNNELISKLDKFPNNFNFVMTYRVNFGLH